MRLKDLDYDEILKRVLASDILREKFDRYIQDTEMYYIDEQLSHFNMRCADWSIGPYNPNHFSCKEPSEFVYCARDMVDMYGCSDKTEKLLSHCEKLRGTNLFEHYADKLADAIEDDFISICKGIEEACYDVYCQKPTTTLRDYIECFADNYIDDVLIDEENNRCYRINYL